jgi:hypothetical protein
MSNLFSLSYSNKKKRKSVGYSSSGRLCVSQEEEYSRSLSFIFRDKKRRKLPVCRLEKLEM